MLDGVIVANLLPDFLQQKIARLVQHHVWLDTNVWQSIGCLQRDEVRAGRLAARALIDAGHKRLVHLVRPNVPAFRGVVPMNHYSDQARMHGLFQEAAMAGVELVPFAVPDIENPDAAHLEQLLSDHGALFIRRMSEARLIASLTLAGRLRGGWGRRSQHRLGR